MPEKQAILGAIRSKNLFLSQVFEKTLRIMDIRAEIVDVCTPKCVFLWPSDEKKLLEPWAFGHTGQECLQEIRTERLVFMLISLPDIPEHQGACSWYVRRCSCQCQYKPTVGLSTKHLVRSVGALTTATLSWHLQPKHLRTFIPHPRRRALIAGSCSDLFL